MRVAGAAAFVAAGYAHAVDAPDYAPARAADAAANAAAAADYAPAAAGAPHAAACADRDRARSTALREMAVLVRELIPWGAVLAHAKARGESWSARYTQALAAAVLDAVEVLVRLEREHENAVVRACAVWAKGHISEQVLDDYFDWGAAVAEQARQEVQGAVFALARAKAGES